MLTLCQTTTVAEAAAVSHKSSPSGCRSNKQTTATDNSNNGWAMGVIIIII